jgi:hypothetical protein
MTPVNPRFAPTQRSPMIVHNIGCHDRCSRCFRTYANHGFLTLCRFFFAPPGEKEPTIQIESTMLPQAKSRFV